MKRQKVVKAAVRNENERRLIDLHRPEILLKKIDMDQWGWHCRWMLLCIGRGDYTAAHKALDSFLQTNVPESFTLDSSIWMLSHQLPYRLLESLESGGYETLRSLDGATDDELRQCDHCGAKHVVLIRAALEMVLSAIIADLDAR